MNYTDELVRIRPGRITDPYNPDRTVPDPTGAADRRPVWGFLDSETADEITGASREETTSGATFYIEDLTVDVVRGDVLEQGDRSWKVIGFPPAPRNPFTGYQPYRICKLEEVRG